MGTHLKVLNKSYPMCTNMTGFTQFSIILARAALTTHKLEWLEPWSKLAELELKCSNRELVDVGNANVTQGT